MMKPPNTAQLELYMLMKEKHEKGEQFRKEDLMDIYDKHVDKQIPNRRYTNDNILTEEQIYSNASSWLNRAISILIRRGYLGLTFKEEVPCSKQIDRQGINVFGARVDNA